MARASRATTEMTTIPELEEWLRDAMPRLLLA
jgi:hypothetical protein